MVDRYIQPDRLTRVPIEGGELRLSAAFDVLHKFEPLGAYVLKYWDSDNGGMSNVMMTNSSAEFLVNQAGLMVVERKFITESENMALITWQANQLTDGDFGL